MVTGYLGSYQPGSQEQLRVPYSDSALVSTVTAHPAVSHSLQIPLGQSLWVASRCVTLQIKIMRASLSVDFRASFRMFGYFVCVCSRGQLNMRVTVCGTCTAVRGHSQRTTFDGIPRAPSCYLFIYLFKTGALICLEVYHIVQKSWQGSFQRSVFCFVFFFVHYPSPTPPPLCQHCGMSSCEPLCSLAF